MTDTRALAERVEGLAGPCRKMDGDIAEALGLPPRDVDRCPSRPWFWYRQVADADFDTWDAPAYTASLDAVVALIAEKLPGLPGQVELGVIPDGNKGFYASIGLADGYDYREAEAATPALALLAAALRAMEKTDDR